MIGKGQDTRMEISRGGINVLNIVLLNVIQKMLKALRSYLQNGIRICSLTRIPAMEQIISML